MNEMEPRTGRLRITATLAVACTLGAVSPGSAASAIVNRDVLALYDSTSEPDPESTTIHRFAEMPLNHLGLRLKFIDLQKDLPEVAAASNYRAVLVWLMPGVRLANHALKWIADAADTGVRLVLMGEIPGSTNPESGIADHLLQRFGLRYAGYDIIATHRARIARVDSVVTAAERRPDPVLPPFPVILMDSQACDPHLTVTQQNRSGLVESVLVATSPAGGFVANNYAILLDPLVGRLQWLIDPFAFFRRALLADETMPVPDVTTISGRRIYFSHIDGDGWNNVSSLEKYREQRLSSAAVVLDELIRPYPGLPVTVAPVGADNDPDYRGSTSAGRIAREIFALSQVEVGSHTYTHPYRWGFFASYDRVIEQALLKKQSSAERSRHTIIPKLTRDSDTIVRAYSQRAFDLGLEVEGALRAAEALAPAGKRVKIYQWSGDALPFEAAIRMTRAAGVRNLNGGDARFDNSYPSIAYLPPIARTIGKERQIYAVNSNDYAYQEEDGKDYALLRLAETLHNTEQPRRLRAFNLYYHMYAGEKSARVNAVRHFLDIANSASLVPISASHYAAIADSFFDTEILVHDDKRWSIRHGHQIETIRFDQATDKTVDFSRSTGIVGMNRHGKALYVALDPAAEEPLIALQDRALENAATRPFLTQSRWRLSNLTIAPCHVTFHAEGFGPGAMSWSGFAPGRYEIKALHGSRSLWQSSQEADDAGALNFTIDSNGIESILVDISCTTAQ
jgi:hypothetical protein